MSKKARRDSTDPAELWGAAVATSRVALWALSNELYAPAAANAFFTLELMLKTLSQLHNGWFEQTHDLDRLFASLPDGVQRKLAQALIDHPPIKVIDYEDDDGPESVDEALEQIREFTGEMRPGFAWYRYYFSYLDLSGKERHLDPFPMFTAAAHVLNKEAKVHGLRGRRLIFVPEPEA